MVGVSTKPALPAGDGREFSSNILGSLALLDHIGRLLLERLLQLVHLLAHVFNCVAGKNLAIVGDSDVRHAEINTDKISSRYWRAIWNIDRDKQEPLAVFAQHKVCLSFGIAELLTLVIAHKHRHKHAAIQA